MSRRGWSLFLLMAFVWGLPYLLIKIAVADLTPAVMVGLRVAIAAGVLLPLALARGQVAPVLAAWPWVGAFALIEITGPFALLGVAEQHISSSLAGLLIAGVPLINALIARALRIGEPIGRRRSLGLLVGILGVASLVGLDVRGGDLWAVLAVLLAALGYASAPLIMETRLQGLPAMGVSAVAMSINTVIYAPFVLAQWPRSRVDVSAWGAVAALGLVCTAFAFLAFFALVAEIGQSRSTVITYLNPAVAVALGIVVLREPLTIGTLVGFPLVILGSLVATSRRAAPGRASATRQGARATAHVSGAQD